MAGRVPQRQGCWNPGLPILEGNNCFSSCLASSFRERFTEAECCQGAEAESSGPGPGLSPCVTPPPRSAEPRGALPVQGQGLRPALCPAGTVGFCGAQPDALCSA